MKIHEYQARELLASYGLPVDKAYICRNVDDAVRAYQELDTPLVVVKAQVHTGGRGKAGGVKLAKNEIELRQHVANILWMDIKGFIVDRVLIGKAVNIASEYYASYVIDRKSKSTILMLSREGGMDIEAVAANTPELIFKEEVEPIGIQPFQARRIAFNLGLSGKAFSQMVKFVISLYGAYLKADASLFEINPVVKTSNDDIIAADAKVNIDDNALFRHSNFDAMRDRDEEDPYELEASDSNLNFVKLDGNVGCMVNGAGLAMATMDIIKLSGGDPANFLDVGGGANANTVAAGFRIILKDPNVKAILVNIFGGIVRCDRVAQGIVDAYKEIGNISVPVIVRLQGTNAMEGKELIDSSGLKVFTAITLQEAADLVKRVV